MTRTTRSFVCGSVYHLISRFVDRDWFITTEPQREHYLTLLARALDTADWRCLSYAIMSNHIHLAMVAGRDALAAWIRRVHSPFADAMNKAHHRIGSMFVRGPKDVFTPPERVPALLAYIHNNPVRAGVVSDARNSSWTSHRAYAGHTRAPRWLHVEEGLQLTGTTHAQFDELVRSAPSTIAGDDSRALELEFEPPDVPKVEVPVNDVVRLAAVELGLSIEDVCSRRKQPPHVLARRVISRCGDRLGASGAQIARAIGTTPQCVSKILREHSSGAQESLLVDRVLTRIGEQM